MDKKFKTDNFIEKEAKEDDIIEKLDKLEINKNKETQFSSELNNNKDSYGIPRENDSEEINNSKESKELNSHRILFKKENEKKIKISKNKHLKRKRIPKLEKKNNKKEFINM